MSAGRTLWAAVHDGEIVKLASRRADVLWEIRANHMDPKGKTNRGDGRSIYYTAPRGEIYEILPYGACREKYPHIDLKGI